MKLKIVLLVSIVLTFVPFVVNAQNTPWTYHEEEDDFGIKTYSLVVAGAKGLFDKRFALSMGCSRGKNYFFIQHAFIDPRYGGTREESLRHILKIGDKVYSMAKRSAETNKIVWRVDNKTAELVSVDIAKFSDGLVGVASKHLPTFLQSIYAGQEMIIGYSGGDARKFSLIGTESDIAKFAKNCDFNIN